MNILFLFLVVVTTALNLTPRDFAIYDEKLRTYQNMTGIDQLTLNEIWEAGITNRKNLEIKNIMGDAAYVTDRSKYPYYLVQGDTQGRPGDVV